MVVYNHSCVLGSGDTTYARNRAPDNAGGILVLGNCAMSWSGETTFDSKRAVLNEPIFSFQMSEFLDR